MEPALQEVIKFINEVVSDNSSPDNPPAADGSSEVNDLLNKLEEQVCYGQMTAEDAGQQLIPRGVDYGVKRKISKLKRAAVVG